MPSDPEELLRSIERTREELALTVDTIAGRLDPKLAAKRGIGKVRSGVSSVVDGARSKLGIDHRPVQQAVHEPEVISIPDSTVIATPASTLGEPIKLPADVPHPELDGKPRNVVVDGVFASAAKAADVAKAAQAGVKQLPKPVVGGGLAALIALAAIIAVKRRQR
jgi:hypothetical protein